MKKSVKFIMMMALCGTLLSCAGQPVGEEGEFAGEDESVNLTDEGGETADSGDGFDDSAAEATEPTESTDTADTGDDLESLDQDLEKEQKVAEGNSSGTEEDPLAEEIKKDGETADPQAQAQAEPKIEENGTSPDVVAAEETKDPLLDVPPIDSAPVISDSNTVPPTPEPPPPAPTERQAAANQITNIKFEGSEGGGSIVIEGRQPLDFTSRLNTQSNQYVIEIKDAQLPEHLKRPFITKDFPSSVGSIDAYQTPGSNTVRVVVQLRVGASEPTTHAEGSSIIVIPPGAVSVSSTENLAASDSGAGGAPGEGLQGGILSSKNLEQFLSGNMKYYGKKISIEVKDIEVRNAINLIAEESGANLIMSEGVTGNLAIKLKNVPWDQALVLILKAKKLGYTRQGNVLRISPMSEIKQEEEDALKLVESRRKIEPLKVQMIPINYAKIIDLQGQIKSVITERGNIVADGRTNSLILTETEEVLERAKKIISSLDIAPAQVLIEGKLVEARESFNKRVGIHWDVSGAPINLGDGTNGPTNLTPNLSIKPGSISGGSLGFNLSLGTLDILGDLNAVLALEEQEENVRVISSPRIVTLHNEEANITQTATVPVVASQNKKEGSVTYKDLNLRMDLKVTPEIASNGVVQMKVDISREFLGAIRDDGSAGSHQRTAKTKVLVKSGQTAVIGGIYQNDSSQMESGVPFLKDIPVLGFLFRNGNFHKDKTELLLFLTPRILSQAGSPVMAQEISPPSPEESGGETNLE
jgi:type IV pilus assembly protein PilQ